MGEGDLIVVGVDGTPEAVRALEWALQEARVRGSPVRAVTVCPPSESPGRGDSTKGWRPPALQPHEARMRYLSGLIRTCMAGSSTPDLRAELVEGRPADVLVARSANAAMLVLGDRSGLDTWDAEPLSGTTWECLRRARCPVLVVPSVADREHAVATVINDPVLD